MSGPTEPQWDLLPDHPEQFFSLSGEYDVRDLKRSYNKLIRQFKPEKYPEEFQRIRAAFERLNDALRYGETPSFGSLSPDLQFDWDNAKTSDRQPAHNNQASDAPIFDDDPVNTDAESITREETLPFHARVKQESIQNLYAELIDKHLKTPYDYYALAVLSDLLPEAEHAFPYWLLEGLKVHREEPALFELLHQYFLSGGSHENREELLEATSRVIRSDRFYYLTEAAWDRLLREKPFESFQQTLESCEMNLLDYQVDHRLVFYLHILKAALWKADKAWIDDMFAQIEEHFDHMSFWLEEEYEFLEVVRVYQAQRTKFLRGGPERIIIDQAIVDFCIQNEQDADRSFLEYQHALVSQEESLMQNFNLQEEEFESVQYLWEKIANEVFDRITLEYFPEEIESIEQQTQWLAHRLLAEDAGLEYKFAHDTIMFLLGVVLFVSLGLGIYCLTSILESFWTTLLKIGGLLFVLILAIGISVLIIDRYILKYYRFCWRFEIMNFYKRDWFPLETLTDKLEQLESIKVRGETYEGLDSIAKLMRKDQGLWFYTTAQRLLTACQ